MMNRAAALRRAAALSPSSVARSRTTAGVRSYATGADGTSRSGTGRFLLYSTLATTLFYGVSIVAALNNDRYQDFFVESVPGGERIIDYLDTHDVSQEIKNINFGGYGEKAVDVTKAAYGSVSGAVGRVLSGDAGASESAGDERDARLKVAETRNKAKDEAETLAQKIKSDAKKVEEEDESAFKAVQDKTSELLNRAKAAADKAEAKVRGDATEVKRDGRNVLQRAVDGVQVMTDIGANTKAAPSKSASSGKGPQEEVKETYIGELPVNHEPPAGYATPRRDRGLRAPEQPIARLRPDPEAPKLPLLAPSIKSLSGSEPMIAQLASTIDELTTFLKETPSSGAKAKGVLESAQIEFEQLSQRLETIKREEAKRVENSLAAQAKRYEAQISKQSEEAANKLSSRESDWQKSFEEERAKQMEQFKEKLEKELATQSHIINERLKEEVIAQGIELQRRWMKDINAKVEEERGGRLAKLDELATELKSLEKVSLDNSSVLDENLSVHTLWTAVRAVQHALDDSSATKVPFAEQLRVLKGTSKARDDPVHAAAIEALESSDAAETGVESFTTLKQWFDNKVGPRVRQVSLVPSPETSGVLSHLASAALSPILFHKKGLVQGEDVPSVLARAEYYLDRKDLDSATRELNQLKGWPKLLAQDWLTASRKRLEVQQALEVVQTEASLASLMVSA
ncbi:related to FCJ1-mitochondrial inner membrane protein involved in formation of crista junctions [Ustilago bromivora]|uniref:MICOS complex subunit MIC60 n=1 Tax=Ustilago bromivora TaxID=307758 RepID=A0A1K0H4H1_9BASI|nr:related to FCJ1-mitochondrial inner membrane protein involved in formation of crista junctions [Ustilago bromivora]SYW82693.1 related to FCJ1 - mitochondrial inner membrane protein involved in formation of crista junctions [Ustilago bromivora]